MARQNQSHTTEKRQVNTRFTRLFLTVICHIQLSLFCRFTIVQLVSLHHTHVVPIL